MGRLSVFLPSLSVTRSFTRCLWHKSSYNAGTHTQLNPITTDRFCGGSNYGGEAFVRKVGNMPVDTDKTTAAD